MKIEWNRVTWYSKAIAVAMGLFILFMGIYVGMLYQQYIDLNNGTADIQTQNPAIAMCGGHTGKSCAAGYHCVTGKLASSAGTCVK